jgi:hypothetical protein
MPLDFTSLEKASAGLERAIKRSKGAPDDEEVRDAVIQRFEYTYELCWKMLKRQLEAQSPSPSVIDTLSLHTYDDRKAQDVYRAALEFYDDARALLESLKKRRDA